ncbi:putative MFS transporter [Aspergillus saccharolyticus JOP 1030-1]|uniref:MFS general substrate transporter n=1 Tax=Aspergillus saccharolyticus JOP 1030-1 TaxID=1450539 RepID=A0A318ZBR1_9EURO|nr:MFS general substrate transporter [Aspergillus saccharolyticus JOP 1030-1]PYH43957.1 MFS general substrate transporter [Aspergillus saccharolyticus JOP 1030-1]
MTSSRAGPTGTTSSPFGSGSSSDEFLYTPASDRSEEDGPSSRAARPTAGALRVQTDFSNEDDRLGSSDDDIDDGYDSYDDDIRPSSSRDSQDLRKYTPREEQQVVKRFDRKLVPFLALLYLLSFLDRSNIGNAKIAGLEEDLQLSSSQYEWLLTAFYITYILFEWMTLMYRLVPPHIYIALCVLGWGLVASFQSLASSFGALVFLRATLGVTEAAFGPGVPFYLSLFYKREELAFRNGLFISAAPLASSFASSLAWVIVRFSSEGPIAPWRTLFLVEGFPSVIVAVFAWLWIPDSPGTARFLDPRQRMIAQLRMEDISSSAKGHRTSSRRRDGSFNWVEVRKTLADPKSYITAFMFFSCNVAFSSMPVFLPTIIADMGYTSLQSQALSAPPYLLAFLTVLLTAYYSDRHRTRSPFLIAHALLSATAYLTLALTGHYHASIAKPLQTTIRYLSLYPAIAGFFSAITLIITWSMDNRDAQEGKGASVALLNLIGQCGPLLGTRLYPASQGPWYVKGMGVCAGCMVLVAGLAGLLRGMLKTENRRRGKQGMNKGGDVEEEAFELERRGGGEESEVLIFGEARRRGRFRSRGDGGVLDEGYIL